MSRRWVLAGSWLILFQVGDSKLIFLIKLIGYTFYAGILLITLMMIHYILQTFPCSFHASLGATPAKIILLITFLSIRKGNTCY